MMNSGTHILDADALLAQAQTRTGLNDWGDSTLPERFRLAVDFLKSRHMDDSRPASAPAATWWSARRSGSATRPDELD